MHLPGIYQPSNRLIYEIFCFCQRLCWQMINTKLLKGNRLLDMTPEGARSATLLKKRLWHRCFPANFVKFSRTPFSQSTSGRLFLWPLSMKYLKSDAANRGVLSKKVFLRILQNSQENTCARVPFLIKFQASAFNTNKKEILAKVFPCEFCKNFKTTFFPEHLWRTASL